MQVIGNLGRCRACVDSCQLCQPVPVQPKQTKIGICQNPENQKRINSKSPKRQGDVVEIAKICNKHIGLILQQNPNEPIRLQIGLLVKKLLARGVRIVLSCQTRAVNHAGVPDARTA